MIPRRIRAAAAGCLALLLAAGAQAAEPERDQGSTSLRLFGAVTPKPFELREGTFGVGGGLIRHIDERWALAFDVASYRSADYSLTTMTAGIVSGPPASSRLRPRVELGFGGFLPHSGGADPRAYINRSVNDEFTGERAHYKSDLSVGGQFGIGLDWRLSEPLSVGGTMRGYFWTNQNNGFGSVQLGLSYRL